MSLTERVRSYWEATPCGTAQEIVGDAPALTRAWFERIESHRYALEPFIHGVAQFTRHHGKRVLEIGVGAGTDHLQFARAGAECHGVDLTQAAIDTTRQRLAEYGFTSDLRRVSAEGLPYEDGSFDLVYSWGVIHHAERPEAVIAEALRVLRPGGQFIGMLYARRSLVGLQFWFKFALLSGKPWRSLSDVIWHHMESAGTRAYTPRQVRRMFSGFTRVETRKILTPYDTARLPGWLGSVLPGAFGWNIAITAVK